MHKISVQDAEKQLRDLVDEAVRGEEGCHHTRRWCCVQARSGVAAWAQPTFGSAKDEVWMSEDVDAPLDDFEDYMPS